MKKTKISIIGNGRLAQSLAKSFYNQGLEISQILDIANFEQLYSFAEILKAKAITSLNQLDVNVDFIIVAISDTAISNVLQNIKETKAIVLHTSGSTPITVFKETKVLNYGVLYPLFTFSKDKEVDFKTIPFLLEANNSDSSDKIEQLVKVISKNYRFVDSTKRKDYHLSAVIVNNFTIHMLAYTQSYLKNKQLDFNLLAPIVEETITKSFQTKNIADIQTGPASRGDQTIMNEHIKMLSEDASFQDLYALFSKSIINLQKKHQE